MSPVSFPRSATQVIKNFRTRELEGLMNHLRLYGPLPTPSPSEVTGSPSTQGDSGAPTEPSIVLPNPFIARKNPKTGKWRGPRYSLRRQADLVKTAKETGNLALIPPGPKLFAMELRAKRLRDFLSPADVARGQAESTQLLDLKAQQEAVEASSDSSVVAAGVQPGTRIDGRLTSKFQRRISALDTRLKERQEKLVNLEEDRDQRQTQHELDELSAFEKKGAEEERRESRKRQAEYASLESQILTARKELVKMEQKMEQAKADLEIFEAEQAQERLWTNPLWVGEVKRKETKGEELGIRLYAGKKKMFKGHTWEKRRAKGLRRQTILMRDMKARIARYKSYYKKRKPYPLKPSRLSKPPKLPF